MNDRLGELRAAAGSIYDSPHQSDRDAAFSRAVNAGITAHMERYAPIQMSIGEMEKNVRRLQVMRQQSRQVVQTAQRQRLENELNVIIRNTTEHGVSVRKTLNEIQTENQTYLAQIAHNGGVNVTARANLFTQHSQKFRMVMEQFNSIVHRTKMDIQERTLRELRIVADNMSEREMEKILESGQADQVIQAALIDQNLHQMVNQIQERQHQIQYLAHSVQELAQLFMDIQQITNFQGTTLDNIEQHVANAHTSVVRGGEDLQRASGYQDSIRRRKCCIITIVLVALAILIIILAAVLSKH